MSVAESKVCCVSDAQYMRLQGIMETIEESSPEDVIALILKCTTMMSKDIRDGELVLLNATDYQELEDAAAAHARGLK